MFVQLLTGEQSTDLLIERTQEALRVKQQQGVSLGRPRGVGKSKLDQFRPEIEALIKNGSTQAFIAKRYGTTRGNLHHWLKMRGIQKPHVSGTL